MSEYQYYEFQALDQPLTPEAQRSVARLSSRVDPDPWRAVFVYHWSDFRGNPEEILTQYYDAMLYIANWGSYRLMFRFPKHLVAVEAMRLYSVAGSDAWGGPYEILIKTNEQYAVLDVQYCPEDGAEQYWYDGQGWLNSMINLREAILKNDYRFLYLAWLHSLSTRWDMDPSILEPPVPPGLGKLTPSLRSFVKFVGLNSHLVAAATLESAALDSFELTPQQMAQAVATLPDEEKNDYLIRLLKDEPRLSNDLHKRLGLLPGTSISGDKQRRTGAQLLALAEEQREIANRAAAAAAAAKRLAELKALAAKEPATWKQVESLIEMKQAKPYDQAVELLGKLRDLAAHQGKLLEFEARLADIWQRYYRCKSLLRRLRQANLIPPGHE